MTKTLSVARKADRQVMAEQVTRLAHKLDCDVERKEGGTYPGERCIVLGLQAKSGLCVSVRFDGGSRQKDTFLLSWNMALDSERKLNPATFGGNVNPYHQRKATYVAEGFEDLLAKLTEGLTMALDGTAYEREDLPTYYIVNLSQQRRDDRYLRVWRPGHAGYAYPLSWAGKYAHTLVMSRLSYYNSGTNLAVPCEVLDALAVEPTPGTVDGDAGPVVLNTRDTWAKVLAAAVSPPQYKMRPVYEGARSKSQTAYMAQTR